MQTNASRKAVTIKIGNGYFGFLGLVLVILKLGHIQPVADWSWWLVTMPWWFCFAVFLLPFAIFLAVCAGGVLVIGAGHLRDKYRYWKRRRAKIKAAKAVPPLDW